MNRAIKRITALAAVIISVPTSAAIAGSDSSETTEVSCPFFDQKTLSYTKNSAADIFEIRLIGDDCKKAMAVLLVRQENGIPVFWDIWPLWNITANPLTEEGEVKRALQKILSIAVEDSAEIPAFDSECFTDEYCYLGEFVNEERYERVRASHAPVMCVPVHYENTTCFFYDVEQHISILLYGFGA